MSRTDSPAAGHAAHDRITLHVRFPAAPKPFIDPHADPSETIGHLKARILSAFELTETSDPNGQTLYILYTDNDVRLDNAALTLGEVAGNEHLLKLKLVQQLTQG